MSHVVVLQLTQDDGSVVQRPVPLTEVTLKLSYQRLIAVSDNIAELTRVRSLSLTDNALTAIPAGVLVMTQLTVLSLTSNRLVAISPEIGRLKSLTALLLGENALVTVPREIGRLTALTQLGLSRNALTAVPPELGRLTSLFSLFLNDNRLTWLPLALDRLPYTTEVYLDGNPFPIALSEDFDRMHSRRRLPEIFAATSHLLAVIRDDAATLAIGLADLELPALVTLEILDAAFPNSIPMHLKWNLITAVKHLNERH